MVTRMPTNCGDETCPSCVIAGDFIFLAQHAGGFWSNDIVHQMESSFQKLQKTLKSVEASLDDMVQINLYLKNIEDFKPARNVFYKYFINGFPARMSLTTDFVNPECLCMLDGIAYKRNMKSKAEEILRSVELIKEGSSLKLWPKLEKPKAK